MGEKGLIREEVTQEGPMASSAEMPAGVPTSQDWVQDDVEVQTVAGDLGSGEAGPPEAPRPLTQGEESTLSMLMTGIEPWNGVVDPPPPPEEGPDVQDVKGDLNDDPHIGV